MAGLATHLWLEAASPCQVGGEGLLYEYLSSSAVLKSHLDILDCKLLSRSQVN